MSKKAKARAEIKKAGHDVKVAERDIEKAVAKGARDAKIAGSKLKKKL